MAPHEAGAYAPSGVVPRGFDASSLGWGRGFLLLIEDIGRSYAISGC
jgi:hypothetical protein